MMKKQRNLVSMILLHTITAIFCISGVSSSAETDANSVEIKVYPSSKSDWTTTVEDAFKVVVAAQATTYCTSSLSACGLDTTATFTESDVTVHSKEESSRSLQMDVYISYPAGANVTSGGGTTEVIPSAALKVILEDARDYVKSSGADVYITWIGSDYHGVPPESTANGIIIPVAFVTVVAVGISAVIMVYAQEHQEKKARLEARQAKKRASRVQPNYDIKEDPFSTRDGTAEVNTKNNFATGASAPNGVYDDSTLDQDNIVRNNTKTQQTRKAAKIYPGLPEASPRYTETDENAVNYFHSNTNSNNNFEGKNGALPPLAASNNNSATTITTTATTTAVNFALNPQDRTATTQDMDNNQQQRQEQQEKDEEKRRRRKEKKREKKRLIEQQRAAAAGFELHDNSAFDTSAMTISEGSEAHTIPTFTVRRDDVDV